jgi:large repetitive protein
MRKLLAILLFCISQSAFAQPTITSFTPTAATQGTNVTITGTNLTGVTSVTFGGVAATSFTVVSATRVDAVAPGATSGNIEISVTTPTGTATRGGLSFNKPYIGSVSPLVGPAGTTITINGLNLNPNAQENAVFIGNIKAAMVSASSTVITALVPASAIYREVLLSTNGMTAMSALPFVQQFTGGTGSSFDSTTFGRGSVITTGTIPTFADFDGDGKQDLATITTNISQMAVLRNQSTEGNINFGSRIHYNTGLDPRDITTGDFNADGKLDIVVVNYNKTISVYINNSTTGNISFAAKQDFSTGNSFASEPVTLAPADVDADGKLDVVVSLYATSFLVMRNTSTASTLSFTASAVTSYNNLYGNVTELAVAEFDGDGKPDVAILSRYYTNVLVFRNLSTPGVISFSTKLEFPYGITGTHNAAALRDIVAADMDNDGKMDLVAAYRESAFVSVLRNTSHTGTISFAPYQPVPLDHGAMDIAVAEMDGDGRPDILATSGFSRSFIKNTSAGNLSFSRHADTPHIYNLSAATYVGVDLDGDSKPELVTGTTDWNSNHSITYYRNHVNGPIVRYFTPLVADEGSTLTLTGNRFSNVNNVSIGGINVAFVVVNDTTITATVSSGTSDEILVNSPTGIARIRGFKHSPPIPSISAISTISGPVGTTVTITGQKFSGTGNTIRFGAVKANIASESAASITVTVPAGASYHPISVTTANNLTAYSRDGFIVTFGDIGPGLNAGNFADKSNYSSSNLPWNITASDLDGDGKPDMIATFYNGISKASVFRNTSTTDAISFSPREDYPTFTSQAGSAAQVTTGDLDGDGKPEMIVNTSGKDSINVFRNTSAPGAITFAPRKDFKAAQYTNTVSVNDIDNDGKPDVVTANASGFFAVHRNQSSSGNIDISQRWDFATSGAPQSHVAADFDGDGKIDVITGNANTDNVSIFRNTSIRGVISFAPRADSALGVRTYYMYAADLDSNGKTDLIIQKNNNLIAVYRNISTPGNIIFAPAVDLTQSTVSSGIAVADMDGTGKLDIVSGHQNNISVFRNNSTPGSLNFSAPVTISHTPDPNSLAVVDYNGDGKPDISCVNRYTANHITVFRNTIGTSEMAICGNSTLSSGLAGSNHQWYLSTDSINYSPITNGTNYNGVNTANLQISNLNSSWNGYRFKCISSAGTSNIYVIKYTVNWIGAAGASWNVASNWSCGVVPDLNTDVVVNSGSVVVTANASCRTLKINPGASVTVAAGVVLTIQR